MDTRKLILCCVGVIAALLLFSSCATKPYVPTEDEPLYGTWANEEYNEESDAGMYIYYPAGRGLSYGKTTDPEPRYECRFTIEEKWTDKEGNIYYRFLAKWARTPYDESLATT